MKKFRVMVMRDSTSSRDGRRGNSSGGGPDADMVMQMDASGEMSQNYGPPDDSRGYRPTPGPSNNGNRACGQMCGRNGNNRNAYGQQVSSNTGRGYMTASSEGTRYNNGPRAANNNRGRNSNHHNNNYNSNSNHNSNNHNNNNHNNNNQNGNQNNNYNNNNNHNTNNQNQDDGGDGSDQGANQGSDGNYSSDESTTGAKEAVEYQPNAAGTCTQKFANFIV